MVVDPVTVVWPSNSSIRSADGGDGGCIQTQKGEAGVVELLIGSQQERAAVGVDRSPARASNAVPGDQPSVVDVDGAAGEVAAPARLFGALHYHDIANEASETVDVDVQRSVATKLYVTD